MQVLACENDRIDASGYSTHFGALGLTPIGQKIYSFIIMLYSSAYISLCIDVITSPYQFCTQQSRRTGVFCLHGDRRGIMIYLFQF